MLPLPWRNDPASPQLVLLVDRDQDTRQMYSEFLRGADVRVEEAVDGPDALAKAFVLHPDCIVTETRLSGIDGYALVDLLRRDPATKTTPVIVVTGDAFEANIDRAWSAGADAVLVKPCLPEVLLGEIRRIAGRSQEPSEHGDTIRSKTPQQSPKSHELPGRSRAARRLPLSRAFKRHDTVAPATAPPDLVCPSCDKALAYQRSHIGGVSERHREQWDYYECAGGCGVFQYRHRTRSLRKVS